VVGAGLMARGLSGSALGGGAIGAGVGKAVAGTAFLNGQPPPAVDIIIIMAGG
jgi:hypothetical protein